MTTTHELWILAHLKCDSGYRIVSLEQQRQQPGYQIPTTFCDFLTPIGYKRLFHIRGERELVVKKRRKKNFAQLFFSLLKASSKLD